MTINNITKKLITAVLFTSIYSGIMAQLPNTFSYQAVVNAEDGSPVADKKITVEISILQGNNCDQSNTCPVLWQELHYPTTNDFGMFSIEIGSTQAVNTTAGSVNNYADIDWLNTTNGFYYLKVRADFGESQYINSLSDLGTTKFSAVPYALATQNADKATNADQATTANSLQINQNGKIAHSLSQLTDVDANAPQNNQILTFSDGKWIPTTPEKVEMKATLNELTDVAAPAPNVGDLFTYDGSKWVNTTAPKTILELKALTTDVNINDPKAGQILSYDGKYWKNTAPAQWKKSTNNNGIVYTEGFVGIGPYFNDYAPEALLHISNANGQSAFKFTTRGLTLGPASTLEEGANQSIVINDGTVNGTGNIVIGASFITGQFSKNCMTIGENNEIAGNVNFCIAAGKNNKITNSNHIFAFGVGLQDASKIDDVQFLIGRYNVPDADALVIIGNGSSTTPNNLLVLKENGDIVHGGNTYNPSDSRLKSNIKTLEESLNIVMQLNGVTFNWNRNVPSKANADTKLQYGFIAQEVEKVLPELVNTDAQGFKSVNYIGVIPVLTQAIKEQQQEINQLKEDNKKLNETLDMLLKRIEALENK